jgi:hypothetical protein
MSGIPGASSATSDLDRPYRLMAESHYTPVNWVRSPLKAKPGLLRVQQTGLEDCQAPPAVVLA